jgi:hypothetical protein
VHETSQGQPSVGDRREYTWIASLADRHRAHQSSGIAIHLHLGNFLTIVSLTLKLVASSSCLCAQLVIMVVLSELPVGSEPSVTWARSTRRHQQHYLFLGTTVLSIAQCFVDEHPDANTLTAHQPYLVAGVQLFLAHSHQALTDWRGRLRIWNRGRLLDETEHLVVGSGDSTNEVVGPTWSSPFAKRNARP